MSTLKPKSNPPSRTRTRTIRPPARYSAAASLTPTSPHTIISRSTALKRDLNRRAVQGLIPFPHSPDQPGRYYASEVVFSPKPSIMPPHGHVFNAKLARCIALKARERDEISGVRKREEEWERGEKSTKEERRRLLLDAIGKEEFVNWVGKRKERIESFLGILGAEEGMVALRRLWEGGLIGLSDGRTKEKFAIEYRASKTGARCRRVVEVGGENWLVKVVGDDKILDDAVVEDRDRIQGVAPPDFQQVLDEKMDFSDGDDYGPPSYLPKHKSVHKTWSDLSDSIKFTIFEELRKTRYDSAAFEDLHLTKREEIELQAIVEAEVERCVAQQHYDRRIQGEMEKLFCTRGLAPNAESGQITPQEVDKIIEREKYEGPSPINNLLTQTEIEDGMSFLHGIELPSTWLKGCMGQLTYLQPGCLPPEPAFQSFFTPYNWLGSEALDEDDGNRSLEALVNMDRDDMTIKQLKARISAIPNVKEYQRESYTDEDDPRWKTYGPKQTLDFYGIHRIVGESEAPSKKGQKGQMKRPRSETSEGAKLAKLSKKPRTVSHEPADHAKRQPRKLAETVALPKPLRKVGTMSHESPRSATWAPDESRAARFEEIANSSSPHLRRRPSGLRNEISIFSDRNENHYSASESESENHLPKRIPFPFVSGQGIAPDQKQSFPGSSPPPLPKESPAGIRLKLKSNEKGRATLEVIGPDKDKARRENSTFSHQQPNLSTPTRSLSSQQRNSSSPIRLRLYSSEKRRSPTPISLTSQNQHPPQSYGAGNTQGSTKIKTPPPCSPRVVLRYHPKLETSLKSSLQRIKFKTSPQANGNLSSPINVKSQSENLDRVLTNQSSTPRTPRIFSRPNSSPSLVFVGPALPLPLRLPGFSRQPSPRTPVLDQALQSLSKLTRSREEINFKDLNYVLPPQSEQQNSTSPVSSRGILHRSSTKSPDKRGIMRNIDPIIPGPGDPEYEALSETQRLIIEKSRTRGGNMGMKHDGSRSSRAQASERHGVFEETSLTPSRARDVTSSSLGRADRRHNQFGESNNISRENCQSNLQSLEQHKLDAADESHQNSLWALESRMTMATSVDESGSPVSLRQNIAQANTPEEGAEILTSEERFKAIRKHIDETLPSFVLRLIKDPNFRSQFAPSIWILCIFSRVSEDTGHLFNPNLESALARARIVILRESDQALSVCFKSMDEKRWSEFPEDSFYIYQNMLLLSTLPSNIRNKHIAVIEALVGFVLYFYQRMKEDESFRKFLPAAKILGFTVASNAKLELESRRAAQKLMYCRNKEARFLASCSKAWEIPMTRIEQTLHIEQLLEEVILNDTIHTMTQFLIEIATRAASKIGEPRQADYKLWASMYSLPQGNESKSELGNACSEIAEKLVTHGLQRCKRISAHWKIIQAGAGRKDENARNALIELRALLHKDAARYIEEKKVLGVKAAGTERSDSSVGVCHTPMYGTDSSSSPGLGSSSAITPMKTGFGRSSLDWIEHFLTSYGPDLLEDIDKGSNKKWCLISMRALKIEQLDKGGKLISLHSAARRLLFQNSPVADVIAMLWPAAYNREPVAEARLKKVLDEMTRKDAILQMVKFLEYFSEKYQKGDHAYQFKWKQLLDICNLQRNGDYVKDYKTLAEYLMGDKFSTTLAISVASPKIRHCATREEGYRELEDIRNQYVGNITNLVQVYIENFAGRFLVMKEHVKDMWRPVISRERLIINNETLLETARSVAQNLAFRDFLVAEELGTLQVRLEGLAKEFEGGGAEAFSNTQIEMDCLLFEKLRGPADVGSLRDAHAHDQDDVLGASGTGDQQDSSADEGGVDITPSETTGGYHSEDTNDEHAPRYSSRTEDYTDLDDKVDLIQVLDDLYDTLNDDMPLKNPLHPDGDTQTGGAIEEGFCPADSLLETRSG